MLNHLIKACPNVEQLHIEYYDSLSQDESADFFNSIQLNHLTWLSISGDKLYDGSYLLSVMEILYDQLL